MAFTVSKQTALWLLIFAIVAAALAVIQVVRVNQPTSVDAPRVQNVYTPAGPVLAPEITIEANSFHSQKLDLNRRMKLSGAFRTANRKSNVSVIIIRESDLENWKTGGEISPLVKTNDVPGGKISPMLEPGSYYLIIDNRKSDQAATVSNDFLLQ